MIHKHPDGHCSISSQQVWMPGSYADERAARYAFRFMDEDLTRLQDEANRRAGGTGGTITLEDLKRNVTAATDEGPAEGTP